MLQISKDTTSRIIDECLDNFFNHGNKSDASKFHIPLSNFNKRSRPHVETDLLASAIDHCSNTDRPKSSPSGDHFTASKDIFKHLEAYITTCFGNMDCLNSSFVKIRPGPPIRAASESKVLHSVSTPTLVERHNEGVLFPDVDAKTLLVGDFAENGAWWTGKPIPRGVHDVKSSIESRTPTSGRDGLVTMKTPNINWLEVYEWYDLIISLQRKSRHRMHRFQAATAISPSSMADAPSSEQWIQKMETHLAESCARVHRTLLKVTENVLRRPGRSIKRPHECRFLLIILANPMWRLEATHKAKTPTTVTKISRDQQHDKLPSNTLPRSSNNHFSLNETLITFKHSGILKRALGLLANLPYESHQCLVNWFSRFSESQLTTMLELIGAFVSYRLVRLTNQERSHSPDPSAGGLIPNLPGPGAGGSADLHATIGVSRGKKSRKGATSALPYGSDWQIKAAAKVMLLFFTANNNDDIKWHEVQGLKPHDVGRARASSGPGRRVHRHRQLLPTSAFYNTLLDYQDLVADFDAWESRKDRFCFCQYPMFLSIWAKIRILEHDARRQMENKARQAFFDSIMKRKAINQYLTLKVRRDCLVGDSLKEVSEVVGAGQEEIKKGLRIEFLGEEGLDSGGLRKEWFLLLVREVFDPDHGLFIYDDDSHYCYFNPHHFETSDQFFLIGALLGLAIYNSTILDIALPPFAFRKLLASAPTHAGPMTHSSRPVAPCTLDDLAEFRPVLAQGLRQLLEYEGDVEKDFFLDFVAVTERYGKPQQVALCPQGECRPVTNANRREYVDLYVRYLLDLAVCRQFEPFKRGFFTVCAGNALSLFRPEEIELLIRGSDEQLDITTLQAVAIYDNWLPGADPLEEPVIQWFWDAFRQADARKQRRLLSFITGSDRIPAMGASSLVIKITCLGEGNERFPTARTCFNLLGLYRYRSRDLLERRLWRAIIEGEGFGMK